MLPSLVPTFSSPRGRKAAFVLTALGLTACLPTAAGPFEATARADVSVPAAPAPEPEPAPAEPETVVLPGAEAAAPELLRTVEVDLTPVVGEPRTVNVVYDTSVVTRSMGLDGVKKLPEWAAGTRLLMGEVGLGRLRESRWSVVEGVGILQTIRNRLDPAVSNPLGVSGLSAWPGCGEGATFQSCIHPKEYLGIATGQALNPRKHARDTVLFEAIDRAVAAWHVFDAGYLGDVTDGATSFVHRCGGSAYGAPTTACDGRGKDTKGANPNTGPIVFKGPGEFVKGKGFYRMSIARSIDYERGPQPDQPLAYASYLGMDDDGVADAD